MHAGNMKEVLMKNDREVLWNLKWVINSSVPFFTPQIVTEHVLGARNWVWGWKHKALLLGVFSLVEGTLRASKRPQMQG